MRGGGYLRAVLVKKNHKFLNDNEWDGEMESSHFELKNMLENTLVRPL